MEIPSIILVAYSDHVMASKVLTTDLMLRHLSVDQILAIQSSIRKFYDLVDKNQALILQRLKQKIYPVNTPTNFPSDASVSESVSVSSSTNTEEYKVDHAEDTEKFLV